MTAAVPNFDVVSAHEHCTRNRAALLASEHVACFYCKKEIALSSISKWLNDGDDMTAVCPHCGVDSVIGSASGFPVLDPIFLGAMYDRWFSASDESFEIGGRSLEGSVE